MSWLDDIVMQIAKLGMAAPPTEVFSSPQQPLPEAPVSPQEPRQLPFYPSERYIKYNRAPETSLTDQHVSAIAKAAKMAENTGTLSPELSKYLLPIAMTEGWGGNMGVLQSDKNAFYASKRFQRFAENMGLKEGDDLTPIYVKGEKHYVPNQNAENGPRLAAAILAEKAAQARQRGDSSVDTAIMRYNGKGKATEEYYGELVPADTAVYLRKVKEAERLLQHPVNADIWGHYQKEYR